MKYRLLGVLAALFLSLPVVAQAPAVPGEPALTSKVGATVRLRLGIDEKAARLRLAPVTEQEIEAVRSRNLSPASRALPGQQQASRLTVGIARGEPALALGARALAWKPVAGGHAAQVAVTSPEAGSLRIGLDLAGVPGDVEMAFFGSQDPSRVEGPVRVGEISDRSQRWWSPLTEGETQTIEVFVPSRHEPSSVPLLVAGASHLFTTPSSRFTKRLQEIGAAGSCNVDLPCSSLTSDSAFRNAANSVAQMVFTDAGFTMLCTGTLLADGDGTTQTPWFFGANHCFDNEEPPYKTAAQMQSVANTLTTLWGFEASACNSRSPRGGWAQLGGGATFVFNNVASDVLFLRLNAAPPAGAFYSGWDANPLAAGNGLVTVHHPNGDLKKVSQGSVVRFASPAQGGATASYAEARWSSGTTEVGSSGAGIWTSNGREYLFRGALWGGTAGCSNPSGTDYYSRFDQAYPALAAYLGPGAAPAHDYSDMWWDPSESGWGLNLVQHPSRVIFGVWYTYEPDGTAVWYYLPAGSWINASTYTGTLYVASGPPYTAPFDPARVAGRPVGTATLRFSGSSNGTFEYSIDGVEGVKSITRLPF